jgi:hypothetical protein
MFLLKPLRTRRSRSDHSHSNEPEVTPAPIKPGGVCDPRCLTKSAAETRIVRLACFLSASSRAAGVKSRYLAVICKVSNTCSFLNPLSLALTDDLWRALRIEALALLLHRTLLVARAASIAQLSGMEISVRRTSYFSLQDYRLVTAISVRTALAQRSTGYPCRVTTSTAITDLCHCDPIQHRGRTSIS